MSRIATLEPPYTEEAGALLAAMMPPGVPPIALFRLFARNLPMTSAMHAWGRYELGRDLTLTMRQREIVIDRTCARCGCEYEWSVHAQTFGTRVALTPDQHHALVHGASTDPCWPDDTERLLIEAVDALHDTSDIDDKLWARLTKAFDDPQLIDLLLLCGWYHAISFVARATRLPLEPGAPHIP
ncbi:carboxymuconolactone decarboxylase family protein [Actinoplanes sp. NPDC051513]|uniref:carboxymuconolactone decarboxylase family protein n=1 Tax=Actinoplanes sp. NPDC051513 TaxID=3363908 RepID=UPI003789F4DB